MEYLGDLGGLTGADSKCQGLANAANLGGTWAAWLSTSTVAAKDRIPDIMYVRVGDEATVATSKADLTDGTLSNPINSNENGVVFSTLVWTGTLLTGLKDANTCNDWTSASGYGQRGWTTFSNTAWTQGGNADCATTLGIYCFET